MRRTFCSAIATHRVRPQSVAHKQSSVAEAGYSPNSFRATRIKNFLENDGTLEAAQRIAGHADSRTTKLYDRPRDRGFCSKTFGADSILMASPCQHTKSTDRLPSAIYHPKREIESILPANRSSVWRSKIGELPARQALGKPALSKEIHKVIIKDGGGKLYLT